MLEPQGPSGPELFVGASWAWPRPAELALAQLQQCWSSPTLRFAKGGPSGHSGWKPELNKRPNHKPFGLLFGLQFTTCSRGVNNVFAELRVSSKSDVGAYFSSYFIIFDGELTYFALGCLRKIKRKIVSISFMHNLHLLLVNTMIWSGEHPSDMPNDNQ